MKTFSQFWEKDSTRGFSLIELMLVVAIIGVLVALVGPKFTTFSAKARQAEVKTNLGHIYTLEQSYSNENDTFIDMAATGYKADGTTDCPANTLGFSPSPCAKARYGYTVTGSTTAVFTATGVTGTAAFNLVVPGCANGDEWTMNQDKALTAVKDTTNPSNCAAASP